MMKPIPREAVAERLKIENPWWDGGAFPRFMADLQPRPYLDLLFPYIKGKGPHRAAVLMGPRRVGKTVLIHHAIQRLLAEGVAPPRICYVSVDHPLYTGMGLEELLTSYREAVGTDFRQDDSYVFFDEIQYLKEWERHLKAIVDRYPNCRCLVSGSAAAALRLKSNESGAGRFTDFTLPPLTFYEYLLLKGIIARQDGEAAFPRALGGKELNRSFLHYLNFGGYPEVALSEEAQRDPVRFVKSDIIDKVLLRDLPSLYGIQDVQELNTLFTTLAFNTGNEVSLEELSRNSGVSKNTIKRYLEYLEAAYLIRILHRVDINAKRFKRATAFKVYLTTPATRAALFGPVAEDDASMGNLVETAIFAQWLHIQDPEGLHYARWKGGEVDFVIVGADQKPVWAIESKWSDRYARRPGELCSLLDFCRRNRVGQAYATSRTTTGSTKIGEVALSVMPAARFCLLLGGMAIDLRLTAAGFPGVLRPLPSDAESRSR